METSMQSLSKSSKTNAQVSLVLINYFLAVSKDIPRFRILKNWFKELSLPELCIVTTTVDKELVKLIRSMYKTQMKYGTSGKFIAKLDNCESSAEAERYEKVQNYNLLFVRDKSTISYVSGLAQPSKVLYSQNMKKRATAAEWLL